MGDEKRTLLWLMSMVFALILIIECFKPPYGSIISNSFSSVETRVIGDFGRGDSSCNPNVVANITSLNCLTSIDTIKANFTPISEGKKVDLKRHDYVFELGNHHSIRPRNSSYDKSASYPIQEHVSTDNSSYDHTTFAKGKSTSYPIQEHVSTDNSSYDPKTSAKDRSASYSIQEHVSTDNSSYDPKTSAKDKIASYPNQENGKPLELHRDLVKVKSKETMASIVSISKMNEILDHSRNSSWSMKPKWRSAIDEELLIAKSQIENAPIVGKEAGLYPPLYRNLSMFKRSYELMEEMLKVYIYREGERPIFHQPVLKGIYGSEGWFMKQLQQNKRFLTTDPNRAHLFYFPFSSQMLEETLYVPNSHSMENLAQYLRNYVQFIAKKYPFWNRTEGADHFLVACHDWAPWETKKYMGNCIRALCNADVKEGFVLGKDVSLPETNVRSIKNPLQGLGGKPAADRKILAFFAGKLHGDLRSRLLHHWQNKDPEMKILGKIRNNKSNNYVQNMKNSKYCICPKGYEVNSPRIVEAIFYECVPVIISDNFVPPFFEVLKWEMFSVLVRESDVPNLKRILVSVPEKRYIMMKQRVKQVQKHFLWHDHGPVKYDIFHMILHSIWYNRVFRMNHQ